MQKIVEQLQKLVNQPKDFSIRNLQDMVMSDQFESHLKLIQQLSREIDIIKIVTPVNVRQERADFLKNEDFHPVFEYDQVLLQEVTDEIRNINSVIFTDYNFIAPPRKLLGTLLENRTRSVCETAELAAAIHSKDTTWASNVVDGKYGEPSSNLIADARYLAGMDDSCPDAKLLEPHPSDSPILTTRQANQLSLMSFDSRAIKYWFEWSLDQYHFDIPVKISPRVTAIAVTYDDYGIIVEIPEARACNGINLLALNCHEIECHARDFMNADALFRPFGLKHGVGRIDSDILTEGHAKLAEVDFYEQYLGETILPIPWYVLAMDYAKTHDFVEVADWLKRKLSARGQLKAKEKAWQYAYRVSRGNPNPFTLDRFAFTKDKAYLEGYLLAKQLRAAGLEHWLELGGLLPKELLEIAAVVDFQPEDLPYKYKNTTRELCEILLADANA